jgi:lipopolysaccharide/colanic/teichoic acid biosynthesis glycosyltransferase
MTRFFDVIFSLFGLVFLVPLFIILAVIGWSETGKPVFVQQRVGRYQRSFKLLKFRTMKVNTASVASHLVEKNAITPYGRFLRKTKLDELPQLWNVLVGEMSLVGPRPCLDNQLELIEERHARNVFSVRPGITGLAQINNIDMSTPRLLAETDESMIKTLNCSNYFKYLLLTVTGRGQGDAAS